MDNNYLVQRRINAHKSYRRKVAAAVILSVILVVLILIGLVKVILDEKKSDDTGKSNSNVTEQMTPVPTGNPDGDRTDSQGQGVLPTATPTPTATPVPTKAPGPKIIVDAGHGGEDLGSVRNDEGIQEKNINLAIALYLQKYLEEAGYEVYMIRTTDVDVDNRTRPDTAIAQGGDAYISIHLNSLEEDSDATRGAETWYYKNRDDGSDVFAQTVIDELTKVVDTRNRGIKPTTGLIVLKYNDMPACLVECGFLTSATERANLIDPEYQKKIAEGICNGIKKYLPIEE